MANTKVTAKAKAAGKPQLTEKQREELIEMCIDIRAHAQNDYEVTLGGNGTNAFEASNVAREVLSILGVEAKSLDTRVTKRAKELRSQNE